jgi:membrane protein implicated in regulation of membrane protease activity
MLVSIYQWGAVAFAALGLVLAAVGLIRGDCPLLGYGKFSDSVVNRVAAGVGIAGIWPAFLVFVLLVQIASYVKRQRLSGRKGQGDTGVNE